MIWHPYHCIERGVQYSRVLKEKTGNAFSDGKTSFDYRRERFASVLAYFSLPQGDQLMAELLRSYEASLIASPELRCGALGFLAAVRNMGKKIVIMTEGPQDAQERTVQGLSIGGYMDFLATTNHFRVTKTSGLFSKVLERLGISPGDTAYIGDNELRDMKPAIAGGIFSILLAETKHVSLNTFLPQINTLRKLQYIISNESP
jgi:putative hydrolase of the HAD superfamily